MKTRLLFLNQCFDKTRLRNLIAWVLYTKGEKRTIEIVEKLKSLGFQFATRAGISLSVDDLKIPSEKAPLVSQAKQQVALADREYERGSVTSIEKLQQLVDTWHRTSETLKQTVVSNFQATDKLSPVYMMAFSGARGNIAQIRQLAGMRGLMADPQGQIIGFPIRSNFREGLTLTEYMISCYGARKGLVDTALRTADAGYLTRRLVDVSQHMVVKSSTCATRRGIVLYDLVISGKSALSLRDRLIGRVLAQDVYIPSHFSISQGAEVAMWEGARPQGDIINVAEKGYPAQRPSISREHLEGSPKNLEHFSSLKGQLGSGPIKEPNWPFEKTKTKIGKRNQEISASLASQIASVQKSVSVRSPLTCSIRDGVCQLCYGWSLSEGRLVNLGEAVGIIAAQSIGEPGTQLTMRTFHTGGVFSGDVMTEIRSPYDGTAHFSNPLQGLLIRTSHGKIAFLTKSPGELVIQSNKSSVSLLGGSPNAIDAPHPDAPQSKGHSGNNYLDNGQKQIETLFTLAASTVVFIRHHEQVSRAQLIAEFSSMGTEINETIEAKRTLFANNAGQISFASLLIGTQTRGNGDIVRVSRDLGFVWILSGRQPGPAALLEILQKGAHIVNQNTIIARVSAFCQNPSPKVKRCPINTYFVNTIDKKIQGMSSVNTIRRTRAIPYPITQHLPLGIGLSGSLRGGKPNRPLKEPKGSLQHYLQCLGEGPRTHDPNVLLLFDSRGLDALFARFDFVATRFVNGDGKQFLPSILYSLMPLTSVDGTKTYRFATPSALVKRATKDHGIVALSSDDRNESCNRVLPALYRSIPSANTPDKGTLLGFKRSLSQEGVGGITDGEAFASGAPIQEARLTLNAKRTIAQQPMAGEMADTASHQSQYLRFFPKLSLPSQRSFGSSIWYRSALSIQRHASSYSLPSDVVSIKKGVNFVERDFITAVNPDNVLVWVFPTRYKVTKKEMVWFDSRCLSQKLTFGELILIEKNLASLCHGDTTSTVSPVVTSCYKTISAQRRFEETVHQSQDQTFLPVRIVSANPLADRPSISNDKSCWDQGPERLMYHHLQCLQAPTPHSQSLVERMKPLQAFQNEDNQTNFKSYSNGNTVSPFREVSDNYSVTSSKFPHLFAKASKISHFSFVNTGSGPLAGRGFDGHPWPTKGWPSTPDPKTKDEKSNRQAVSYNSPKIASRFALGGAPTPKRLFQCNKVAATKSWFVNFENNYSFTKKKALKLQNEHFLHSWREEGDLHSSREKGYLGGFNRGNMADAVGGTTDGEATASRLADGVGDPSKTQEAFTSLHFVNKMDKAFSIACNAKNPMAKTFQTNSSVLDSLTKIYHRAKILNDRLGFRGTGEEKDGQRPSRSFIKLVRTSNKDTSLSSVKEWHTVTIFPSIEAPPICPKDRATRQSPRLEGDITQPIYNYLGSGFEGHPFVGQGWSSNPRPAKGPLPQKHSSFWIYCPQEIHKVSVLHESVDFYRNWQFDKLCFDSSLTYIKGLFSSELLYQVKNNLDPIVSKLYVLSKRNTTFSQLCKPTGLLLTQPLRIEMGGGRTISLQPYSNVFVSTSQPQNTLSGSNRQYLSVYRSFLQVENSGAEKLLKDTSLSSVKKRDFGGNPKLCKNKFLLHFAGPNLVDSLKRQSDEGYTFSDPKFKATLFSRRVKDTFLPLLKKSPFQESRSVSIKKAVIFFLRKWMQIPQPCALHEGVIYLNKWDNASSLSKVLQIEQLELTTTQTVKISVPCHGHKGSKLFFDTHSCFQSSQLNQKINCTWEGPPRGPGVRWPPLANEGVANEPLPQGVKNSHLQEDHSTTRYRLLVWKNLMNCKPFLLLRACPLQVQIVSNTKARNFLPISVAHPLSWQSLTHASDLRKENLQARLETSRRAWYKTLKGQLGVNGTYNNSTKAPENRRFEEPERLTSLGSEAFQQEPNGALNVRDFKENSFLHSSREEGCLHFSREEGVLSVKDTLFSRKVKESLYKLNLRQRLGFGPLPLKMEEAGSFFDSISNLATEVVTNRVNNLSQVNGNLPITELQQREICWPYSSQPTIFAVASKGCSILLPSIAVLTTSHNSQSKNEKSREADAAEMYYLSQKSLGNNVDFRSSQLSSKQYIRVTSSPKKSLEGATGFQDPRSLGLLGSSVASNGKGPRGGSLSAHDPINPKRGKREITKLYTSSFRFVTKVKKTLLVTNCKPKHLSLMPLLLSRDFCTRVVSNESYLIRFFGNISSPLTRLRSVDSTVYDDSATCVSSNHQLSPAMGEIVSQDTDFRLSESGRLLPHFTPSPSIESEMLRSGSLQPIPSLKAKRSPSLFERKGLPYVKSISPQGVYTNTVLLTEGDQLSMSLSEKNTNVSVGEFVTLGEEFVPGYAALVSGQVVAIEQNKITLRRTQALLFYAQGVTHVNHGQWVNKNAPILTLTYQKLVTGDIVQGIPKIEQFFEAPATREGEPLANSLQLRLRRTYQRLKSLLPLAEAVKQSLEEIQQVLVEGILRVYLSQGVRIADKHLEIVIRQMTSKGQVLDVGDTGLFQGEFVNLNRIERINLGTYGQKADYEPSVLGITQASLGSESFISAASFQETTRVLSRDTIIGKTDFLRGLKERVVLGDVIQAGTGLDDNINYGLLFGVTSS